MNATPSPGPSPTRTWVRSGAGAGAAVRPAPGSCRAGAEVRRRRVGQRRLPAGPGFGRSAAEACQRALAVAQRVALASVPGAAAARPDSGAGARRQAGGGLPVPLGDHAVVRGRSAATVPPEERDGYAVRLAAFFRALHVPAPADAPKNPVRGVPLKDRDATVRGRLEESGLADRDALLALWDDGIGAAEHRGPRLWVHGDPHPHNVVVGARGLNDDGQVESGCGQ